MKVEGGSANGEPQCGVHNLLAWSETVPVTIPIPLRLLYPNMAMVWRCVKCLPIRYICQAFTAHCCRNSQQDITVHICLWQDEGGLFAETRDGVSLVANGMSISSTGYMQWKYAIFSDITEALELSVLL